MLVQRSQEEFELLLLLVGNRGFAMANVVAMGGGGGGGFESRTNGVWMGVFGSGESGRIAGVRGSVNLVGRADE